MKNLTDECFVLRTDEGRYFYRFGNKSRVMTAYTLAGAKMFSADDKTKIEAVENKLHQKGKNFERVTISSIEGLVRGLISDFPPFASSVKTLLPSIWVGLEKNGEV